MDIPPNFDKLWSLSNVTLVAENANGRLLYANKAVLAAFLKYFRGLFFSGFQEIKADTANVPCDYDALHEILRIIYHVNHQFNEEHKRYDLELLTKIYEAADYLDSCMIRKMCVDQLLEHHTVEAASAALKIGLRDTLIAILDNLSPEDGKKFLQIEDTRLLFSKIDVSLIYEMVSGKMLPDCQDIYPYFYADDLVDLCNTENPLIDSTKMWRRSDVSIKTKNSKGKQLFSNKTVLSMVSPHFEELFFSSQPSSDSCDFAKLLKKIDVLEKIDVDVDYYVMKNILSIIHHSSKGNLMGVLSKNLIVLCMMLYAASETNLDIPMIRDLCKMSLLEFPDNTHLEVAVKLNLDEEKRTLFHMITVEELLEWIYNSGEETDDVITLVDGQYEIGYTGRTKTILSLNDVRIIVERQTRKVIYTTRRACYSNCSIIQYEYLLFHL